MMQTISLRKNLYLPEGRLLNTAQNRALCADREGLGRAALEGTILEGICVLCDNEQNLHVNFGSFTGRIPRDECVFAPDGERVKDIAVISRVGKPLCFKVTNIDGELPVLSRRAAQRECMQAYINSLTPGDIIDARVTHMESFGVFVDVGCGVVSLLPIDALSVSRISHPRDRVQPGQELRAVVKSAPDACGRMSLSHRELLGTWEENAAQYNPGETAAGVIRSVESYGVFVELTPNLAGLAEYKEGAVAGKSAAVYIKSIIREKMKIKLVLIDIYPGDAHPAPLRYFTTERRIDRWLYSPPECDKIVESVFI